MSAPPGYGKTTLVTAWLAAAGLPAAWVTLDETDDDPAVFTAYLAAAVRRVVPELDPAVEGAMTTGVPPASLAPLLNALAALEESVAIVLDDYHLVTSAAVHEMTAFLGRHAPPNVRVVIVTRQDPPLPLARLRVRGQLTEVRTSDLRFGVADAVRFLGESMGLDLQPSTVEQLTERTEGWVAGLQLAGLSLRGGHDPDAFVAAFGSTDRYIFDYLTDEALANQSPEVRTFLEATCILRRLSGPLCDALTGRGDGSAMLASLTEANLFLVPLDDRREWFRYHRLFADLVASSLDDTRLTELHRRAAAWFASHDLPVDAIRHSLAAGDAEGAATLMEGAVEHTLARGEMRTVLGWCSALSADRLAAHPSLGIMRAWATFFLGDIAGAEALLTDTPRASGDGPADARASARRACLEAWFANRHDRPEAETLARRAIEGIPEADPVFRSLAFTTLGESLVGRDVGAAVEAFESAHRLAEASGRSALLAGSIYSLANTWTVFGRRQDAEALCRRTIADAAGRGGASPSWLGMLHIPLGTALFEANELAEARQHIALGQELCERAGLRITMLGASEWHEILGLHLAGDRRQAWRRLEAVRRDADAAGILRYSTAMALLAVELLLLEGDLEGARRRLEEAPGLDAELLGTVHDRSRVTRARVLAALGSHAEALEILQPLAAAQRTGGRMGRLVATLAAIAFSRERLGERPRADAALAEAVRLAAGEGYRRAFVDPVLPVTALLPRVRHLAPAFVDDLVGIGDASGSPGGTNGAAQDAHAPGDPDAAGALIEPLSVRELEVLRLVAAGLSNDEIGQALYVSAGTAKWHVHNVIAKLGARNRVTLVAKARALRLI